MLTDPIADMLTRVRNANLASHVRVEMPTSKVKVEIARVLKEEGYIAEFGMLESEGRPQLWIEFKPRTDDGRVLSGLRRISRPGLRVYRGRNEMPRVLAGLGVAIVSTSRGVMSGQQARRLGVGGEVIAEVW